MLCLNLTLILYFSLPSYCCLTCLLSDGKCQSQSCRTKNKALEEKTYCNESSEHNSPWVAIKQRAGLRTQTQSLLDPSTFVFREGMSVYQNRQPLDNETGSQDISNNLNENDEDCLMEVPTPDSMDIDISSMAAADHYSSLKTSCKTETSQNMDISVSSLSSLTFDTNSSDESSSSVHCLRTEQNNEDITTNVASGSSASTKHCESNSSSIDDNGEDFGRGWWKRRQSNQTSLSSQFEKDDGRDFGSGWWKPRQRNCKKVPNKGGRNNKRNTSDPSGSTRKRVKNSDDSDSNTEFGSGWWVGRLDGQKKVNQDQSSNVRMDVSRNNRLSKNGNKKSYAVKVCKPILDVVPYRALANPSK